MKNKPIRHKTTNTFKFESFTEQVEKTQINVFHHVKHKNEEYNEEEINRITFFQQTLNDWVVLNLTEGFESLQKQLPSVPTLPQLILLKDDINNILINHLKKKEINALEPTLKLVIALANDLRNEFYPYFSSYLPILIDLLDIKDPESLKWIFDCLAYLFKFLLKYLKNDIKTVLINILPFLSDSKPKYINNFAAEIFSFVARKVKDKQNFMKLIFKILNKNPGTIHGCSQLLFEIIFQTVTKEFHSCADSVLPLYWECLTEETFDNQLVQQTLEEITDAFLFSKIKPNKCGIFWQTLMVTLEKFCISYNEKKDEKLEQNITFLFGLIIKIIDTRDGIWLSFYKTPMIEFVIKFIEYIKLSEKMLLSLITLISKILLSSNLQISQEEASTIILKVLKLPQINLLYTFIEQMFTYSSFESLIQPKLLKYCSLIPFEKKEDFEGLLLLLSKLVVYKAPLLRSSVSIESWKLYPLNINENEDFINHILINIDLNEKSIDNLQMHICSLLITPHINSIDKIKVLEILKKNLLNLIKNNYIKQNTDISLNLLSLYLYIFNLIMFTTNDNDTLKWNNYFIPIDQLIEQILIYMNELSSKQLIALRILDLYLTGYNYKFENKDFNEQLKINLYQVLIKKLSSPFHEVRLMTSNILTYLDSFFNNEHDDHFYNVLTICLKNEKLTMDFENHRDILYNINELKYENVELKDKIHLKESLYYLFGVLYRNFKPLWKPTLETISSYAMNMNRDEFWSIYLEQLEFTTARSQNIIEKEELFYNCDGMPEFLYSWFSNQIEDRVDHLNFRYLLWNGMLQFVEICEAKNRDITRLFLTFLEEEYYKFNLETAKTWNVKQHDNDDDDDDVDVKKEEDVKDDEEDYDNDKQNIVEEKSSKSKLKKKQNKRFNNNRNKSLNKTGILIAQLELFSKFSNPKAIYKEDELKKIYYEFLKNFNPGIQKKALECLCTYKFPYLTPYKQHLFGLLDDTKFKTTIVLFQLDETSELIQPTHRSDLIPLVLRIVYPKMLKNVGHRAIVLRFLAGCNEEELSFFIQMSLYQFHNRIQDNSQEMIEKMSSELDLEHCIPPKRFESSLQLLITLYEQIGHHLGPSLISYTIRIVFLISTYVHELLASRNQTGGLHSGYVNILKKARTKVLETLTRIFEKFDRQEWTVDEIESLFKSCIWPMLTIMNTTQDQKMEKPTACLKLFSIWSKNPRYHILLAKSELTTSSTIISYLIDILNNQKARPNVINHILDMVHYLLTFSESVHDDNNIEENDHLSNLAPLKVLNVYSVENFTLDTKLSEPLNIGSKTLLPYISTILECLQRRLTIKSGLSERDLIILLRVSELALILKDLSNDKIVWADTLLKLILPIAIKQASGKEDIIQNWIVTMENLIQIISDPAKYLRSFGPLFGRVIFTPSRKRLLIVMEKLVNLAYSKEDLNEQECLQVLMDLNSYDRKWLDQPDYDKRLDGHKKILTLLEQKRISFDFGSIFIHQCFFVFHHEKDLALRDCASHTLKQLSPKLALQLDSSYEVDYLITKTILPLVRYGIRSKNDHVRDESLALLGEMARQCSRLHTIFTDLEHLTNSVDLEVDFFENLRHLQSHRHGRALLKFVEITKSKRFHVKTLIQIILPIVTHYLLNDKYSKHTIVNSAIEALDAVSRLLPWHQYDTLLRFYLAKLRPSNIDHQKQLTRIVITILDAFHFDLSKATYENNNIIDKTISENSSLFEKKELNADDSQLHLNKEKNDNNIEIKKTEENFEMKMNDINEQQNMNDDDDDDILEEMCNDLEKTDNQDEEIEKEIIKTIKIIKPKPIVDEEKHLKQNENVNEEIQIDKENIKEQNSNMDEINDENENLTHITSSFVDELAISENTEEIEEEKKLNESISKKRKLELSDNDIDDDDDDDDDNDVMNENGPKKKIIKMITQDDKMDYDKSEQDKVMKNVEEQETRIYYEIQLTENAATRVAQIISKTILPQLKGILEARFVSDFQHKFNRKISNQEEQYVLRVPIALAAVKLLQKLPKIMLDMHLSSILLKLSNFLKSRLDSVRRETRKILQTIMQSLGPKYLHLWLDLVKTQFTRGYECHVLVYTVHGVLNSIRDQFQPDDINESLQEILHLCHQEIFGHVAEEKEIAKVAAKVFEARSTKSYETYQILAQYITESCFTDLLSLLKDVLYSTRSFKVVHKANECLRRIVLGLNENQYISIETLLKMTHGLVHENIPDFQPPKIPEKLSEEQKARQRPDIFIIPQAPKNRMGILTSKVITSSRTNTNCFVEFGLYLLHTLLKNEQIVSLPFRSFLDPFLKILTDCIDSIHIKLSILAISCLLYLLKMTDLPSLQLHIDKITTAIFQILHKYAVANLTHGEHSDLVSVSFKALTILIRSVTWYTINEDQLKQSLFYAEQDIDTITRQSTAFGLLRAILNRKLVAPELENVMLKVSKLSILSTQPIVRLRSRQVFLQYMLDYPIKKKINKYINFYLDQLEFKLKPGRESALEMLHSMIQSFPYHTVQSQSINLFINIGMRLENDDEPQCRKMASICIKTLIKRLNKKNSTNIFNLCCQWLQDQKVTLRSLGLQLCGVLVTCEKSEGFELRLEILAPFILGQFTYKFDQLDPARCIRHPDLLMKNQHVGTIEARDHLFYHTFQLCLKLCNHVPSFLTDTKYTTIIYDITDFAHRFLSYPHDWVQLSATQLLGYIFNSIDISEITQCMVNESKKKLKKKKIPTTSLFIASNDSKYLLINPLERIKSLILDHCELLEADSRAELINQVLKNLVYLGRILKHYAIYDITQNTKKENKEEFKSNLSIQWMIRRLKNIINKEIIHNGHNTEKRLSVFKWFGALIMDFNIKEENERLLLERTAPYIMMPLVREMTITVSNAGEELTANQRELAQLSKQVAQILKKKLGLDLYTKYLNHIQMRMTAKRSERKKIKKQEAITNPEQAAKRKIEKQLKKKELKKRKLEELKGTKKGVKKKKKKMNDEF